MSCLPVNPKATPEARELLSFLYDVSGRRVMTGQHNVPGRGSADSAEAAGIGGAYPAIWGQDFGFSADDHDGVQFRDRIIEEAIEQHRQGSIVTLMWHAVRPTHDEPVTFKENIIGSLTDDEWVELVTPGTPLHHRWIEQTDVIASLLLKLKEAKIPVLWRPYHEMNGDWFWWCDRPGPDGYEALWRHLYYRFVHVHELHNLVWVWNANAPRQNAKPYRPFYPGHDVVDVLATDVYNNDYQADHYREMLDLAEGKPIGFGEVGQMPTPELLAKEPRWCWFMTWSGFETRYNDPAEVRRLFSDPRSLNRPAMLGN
ncbi:MAG: glycosyl hydrolase [Fimbriimonas sp.]|nr:glycosyl hydrolase [Fimbriimonas sp.]